MTLKVVLKIDPERGGEQLIALLVKAYSRGELGIADMLISRWDGAPRFVVGAPKADLPAKPKRKMPSRVGLGITAMKTGKPNGAATLLIGLSHGEGRVALAERWTATGLNINGLGASLSKLAKRGYIGKTSNGTYRLTSMGADFVNQWNEKHDHENREQP